jgi:hypothetical protein
MRAFLNANLCLIVLDRMYTRVFSYYCPCLFKFDCWNEESTEFVKKNLFLNGGVQFKRVNIFRLFKFTNALHLKMNSYKKSW